MRSLFRGIPARMLLASAICAGLSAVMVTGLLLHLMVKQSVQRAALLVPALDPLFREQCERDPQGFLRSFPSDREIEMTLYDLATQVPLAPDMAPVDRLLLQRLQAGERNPGRLYFFSEWGGAAMRQTAERGPCSLLQLRWRKGRFERRQAWLLLFGLPMLTGALAVLIASSFAVRPLTQRLRRLRKATEQVGQATGYASAGDPESDDLGMLSLLLDQAHARIARDAEQAVDRQKALEQHLVNVAHDLRTPLASLQLTVERLSESTQLTIERITDSTMTPDSDLVRNAIDDVVYMGALIGNLYLACRLQDGADPLRDSPRVDLCVLIEHVTRRFRKLGQARAIEVHANQLDHPVWVRCNPAMAEQVVQNLVHNAVAYGDEGGHVAVLLEVLGNQFTLHVVDDGPGVPPTDLPRLGDRTFRSDAARQRDPQGSGLGLAITSEVCRRAGFTLRFAREEPRGLRVTVTGPCLPAQG